MYIRIFAPSLFQGFSRMSVDVSFFLCVLIWLIISILPFGIFAKVAPF